MADKKRNFIFTILFKPCKLVDFFFFFYFGLGNLRPDSFPDTKIQQMKPYSPTQEGQGGKILC